MDNLYDEWIEKSKKMLEVAKQRYSKDSKNKVFPMVDGVGAIQAYVFGEEGIVSVVPCYDDQEPKFATRLVYPEYEKIVQAYSNQTGIDASEVSITDDKFIAYALELFAMKDSGWEITKASWDHQYSRYSGILYDTMQDAVNSIYTDDVFCCQTKREMKRR